MQSYLTLNYKVNVLDLPTSRAFAALRRAAIRLPVAAPTGLTDNDRMTTDRIEVTRTIAAEPAAVFAVLRDPQGHVAIDSSGMLQSAEGEPVGKVGDSFVVHMDRESLNDYPELGRYDVTVVISAFEKDREIAWKIVGQIRPPIGHVYGYQLEPVDGGTLVTSFYDWSDIDERWRAAGIFPVISEGALRATLGILARTVSRGWPTPTVAVN
jgi:hypothetical protein